MALTATATYTTRRSICRILGMKNTVIVAQLPNRPNIRYAVYNKPENSEDSFCYLIEELHQKIVGMERTIIFGQTYRLYSFVFDFQEKARNGNVSSSWGTTITTMPTG